eukprot:GHUV01030021.1.p3 GENE.GHUV01030021.1~~GHUV01030021.1.p3  ORF type:complete len:105 (-),score=19.08 GHUV01030021.1:789-1103(-)
MGPGLSARLVDRLVVTCAAAAFSSPVALHYFDLCSGSWTVAVPQVREEYDVRVMQLAKQRREGVTKVVTGKGGVTRYEARLDSKKHRTTSRRKNKQSIWDQKEE